MNLILFDYFGTSDHNKGHLSRAEIQCQLLPAVYVRFCLRDIIIVNTPSILWNIHMTPSTKRLGPIVIFSYKIAIFPNIKCNQDIPLQFIYVNFWKNIYPISSHNELSIWFYSSYLPGWIIMDLLWYPFLRSKPENSYCPTVDT